MGDAVNLTDKGRVDGQKENLVFNIGYKNLLGSFPPGLLKGHENNDVICNM